MAQKPAQVKILIASPRDVAEERKIVADEIGKWNIVNREVHGVELEAVMWERHAYGASGDRAQGILDAQIVSKCHFAIAMFHSRIGTDTGFFPGGAVEEIELMLEQGKQVMCWFSGMPLPIDVDTEQLHAVRKFKADMQSKALCSDYADLNDFRQQVALQLSLAVTERYGNAKNSGEAAQSSNESYALFQNYQDFLKRDFENLNLSGSSAIAAFSVALSDTFVSLRLFDTLRSEERLHCELSGAAMPEETRERSPEELMTLVFRNYRLLLVIGDPGLGKTTLLKYYALSCFDGKHEAFGFTSPVGIFWLPLRELKRGKEGYGSLALNLAEWCKRNCLDDVTTKQCSRWLDASESLVLLDGLDEVSEVSDRIELCRWIDQMVTRYGNARFLVTSRSTGYRKGDGIEIVTPHIRTHIMTFNDEQQADFLTRWFRAAYRRELPPNGENEGSWRKTQENNADKKAAAITEYLAAEENRSIKKLAEVPLLLQIMALLWKDHEYLPEGRMKLYDAALDYLLDYRDRQRKMKPLLSVDNARRVLGPVALWMQEEVKKDEARRDAVHDKMEEVLVRLNTKVQAPAFCRNLVDRAGVLVLYGDAEYVFRHKTFREYLAAVQLEKNIRRTAGFMDALVPHFGDDWWSEVFRFFIVLIDDAELFERFMLKLFDSPVTESLTPKQQVLLLTLVREAPQKQYGELIEKLLDPATTANRRRYLVECLKAIDKEDALEAVRQFEKKGGTELFSNPLELDAHYILIKGGTYTYSVNKKTVIVPDFHLARYPVTNRQYRRFISYLETGKLDEGEVMDVQRFRKALAGFGKKERLSWLVETAQWDKDLAEVFRSVGDDDKRFNGDNQPVVSITWYAARSYCLWLSLVESEGKHPDLYRLPEETEWEYAAAGKEGRTYPWGETDPAPKLANYNSNEGATTSVGSYPDGATPEGLYDMAGNVWEWMENWYDDDKNRKTLRGGSWYLDAELLACSSRGILNPSFWSNSYGFRVVRPSPKLDI